MSLHPLNSLAQASAERHFFKAVGWAARTVTAGVTTPEMRRDRLRDVIVAADLDEEMMWKTADGRGETFRQAWERLYELPFYGATAAIVEGADLVGA